MKLIIYREDLKILIKEGELPEIKSDDYEKIKLDVLEKAGFHVVLSGKRNPDFLVAKRVFGPVNRGYSWEEVKSEKFKKLIDEDVKFWQSKSLETINKVFQMFGRSGIELYLFGGWGADFLKGEATRPHVDIDLFAWSKDKEIVRALLLENGYSPKEKGTKFQHDKEGFDIYFLDPNNVIENPHGFTASPELLKDAVEATLAGVTVKVVSPKLFKEALEKKLKFNQKNANLSGGPIDKTAHDLAIVEEYLQS